MSNERPDIKKGDYVVFVNGIMQAHTGLNAISGGTVTSAKVRVCVTLKSGRRRQLRREEVIAHFKTREDALKNTEAAADNWKEYNEKLKDLRRQVNKLIEEQAETTKFILAYGPPVA